jgi:peptidoglycan/xylan/chitin deacetylase (PgdA/CDA1 family)
MNTRHASLLWRMRSMMTPESRRMLRRLSDPWIKPFGSIVGAVTSDPVVALTFDDGPHAEATPKVLDVLARYGATATFFVLLDRAEAHPALIKRMIAEGHSVGLHGVDHRRLTRMGPRQAHEHIQSGVDRFVAAVGRAPTWFRPPYGSQSVRTFFAARRCGMHVVAWSADCADWMDRPEETIAEQAITSIKPGGILLLHDTLAADPEVQLPDVNIDRERLTALILERFKKRGLSGVSLEGLLSGRRAHRTAWFRP